jgi:hypothetical protein
MKHVLDLIFIALIAGALCIWLVDRTNKKSYKANDWEVLRIVALVVAIILLTLGFAILG